MLNVNKDSGDKQWFLPRRLSGVKTLSGVAQEKEIPFSFPKTIKEKISTRLASVLPGLNLGDSTLTKLYIKDSQLDPLSFGWKKFLNYLARENSISSPYVKFEEIFTDQPKIFSVTAKSSFDSKTSDALISKKIYSVGNSDDPDEAITSALGEYFERQALARYFFNDFTISSFAQLKASGKLTVEPSELTVFTNEQRKKNSRMIFDEKSQMAWVQATNFSTKKKTFIPAQTIFLSYRSPVMDEPILRESNSNGAAGHISLEEAILSGLNELIERDAFLIFWLNKITPTRVDLDTITDTRILHLIDEIKNNNFTLELCDLSIDTKKPVFFAFLIDKTSHCPKFVMGGGCAGSAVEASRKAILEAIGIYRNVRTSSKLKNRSFSLHKSYEPFFEHFLDKTERMLLWSSEEFFKNIGWFLSGKKTSFKDIEKKFPIFTSSKEELLYTHKHLKSLGDGYEIYYFSSPESILHKINYHVVKVVVPALVPLYLRESLAVLGSDRLYEVPKKLKMKIGEFPYPTPHPFL